MVRAILYAVWRLDAGLAHVLRRFTPAGRAVLVGVAASGVLGMDPEQTLAYQAFAVLFTLLVLSFLLARRSVPALTVSRTFPDYATAGEPLRYRVVVRNPTRRIQRGLAVVEELPPVPTWTEVKNSTQHPRVWSRTTFARRADAREYPLPDVPPGGTAEVTVTLVPLRRGRLDLRGIRIVRYDPFGLRKVFSHAADPRSVLVLPARYPMAPLTVPGLRRHQPGGVTLASSVGESDEVASVRVYRPGDPIRRVHWRSWAKVGSPMVKELEDEYFVRYALLLDTDAPSGDADTIEEAIKVAASVVCAADEGDSLLDLVFSSDRTYCLTAGRGVGGVERLLEHLASIEPSRRPFADLAQTVCGRASSISGAVCVFAQWDEERRDLVRRLLADGIPLLALVVTASESPYDPGPLREHPDRFKVLRVGSVGPSLANWA